MRKWISLLLTLLLVFPLLAGHAEEGAALPEVDALPEGFVQVAESETLRLYLHAEDGRIILEDLRSGKLWRSNPDDAGDDPIAKGIPKTNLQSQFLVSMYDEEGLTSEANTQVASVNRDAFSWEAIEGGVRMVYDFPRESEDYLFVADITLAGDSMRVEVRLDLLQERSTVYPYTIGILPYMGAGGPEDAGYIVLPDGSGAVIAFNNGRHAFGDYSKAIFGNALTISRQVMGELSERLLLPVYGIVHEDGALLCEFVQGNGRLQAMQAQRQTSYTTAYFAASARYMDSTLLANAYDTQRTVTLTSGTELPPVNPVVRYYPLTGDDTSYSGVARKYREVLAAGGAFDGAETRQSENLYLTLTGAVTRRKAVMGIPFQVAEPLTTFSQAEQMLDTLRAAGVQGMTVRYLGWLPGGIGGKAPTSAGANGQLGGNKGLSALAEYAAAQGIALYPDVELVQIAGKGNGFGTSSFAKGLTRSVSLQQVYMLSTLYPSEVYKPGYVVSSEKLYGLADRFADGYDKLDVGAISPGSLGYSVFYDWRDGKFVYFETISGEIHNALKRLSESNAMLLSVPNRYALSYAAEIADMPVYSSGHRLFDYDVPFVQMVLHGMVPYGSTPVNRSDDTETFLLRAVESGTALAFRWVYEDPSPLRYTQHNDLYADWWQNWLPQAGAMYARVYPALNAVAGATIIEHVRLTQTFVRVTYDNGRVIYVNYGTEAARDGGVTVPARDWLLVEV